MMRSCLTILTLLATVAPAAAQIPTYDLGRVAQFEASPALDTIPADPAARRSNAEAIAMEATLYGLPAVLQYAEMYAQALPGRGWNRIEKARYGFNYLNRATINFVGLGANVSQENYSFNTFADITGTPLDGGKARYTLTLDPPPPVNAFWSLTLYDADTYRLHPNPLNRYLINDRTPGLKVGPNGTITITIARDKPAGAKNWLPAPNGPFYLALRAYLPKPALLAGEWTPPGVTPER